MGIHEYDQAAEAILIRETPKAWAAVRFGDACWLHDRPAPTPDPVQEPAPAEEPFEPSGEDLTWWAVETAPVEVLPAIRGGAPCPDECPPSARDARCRVVRGWTDHDQAVHGAV